MLRIYYGTIFPLLDVWNINKSLWKNYIVRSMDLLKIEENYPFLPKKCFKSVCPHKIRTSFVLIPPTVDWIVLEKKQLTAGPKLLKKSTPERKLVKSNKWNFEKWKFSPKIFREIDSFHFFWTGLFLTFLAH